EKSIKNLRGHKKEDVIFAGSSSRAKLGCAQVSVFFDNSKKQFDIDYDQVIVTRKVYRDGENSYLVNNNKVKLFDLINLLSKAGIGYSNYTIVNQGMTDKTLLSSPLERMGFLEDAAGVKEFQLKKNQSVRRMKKTKGNIEKAESVMREIKPELRVLKSQSRKIEKSQKTREDLAEKRKQYFAVKLNNIEKNQSKNNLELEGIEDQLAKSRKKIKEINQKLQVSDDDAVQEQNQLIGKIEKEKTRLENQRYKLERAGFKNEIRSKSLQEKIEQLDEEEVVLVDRGYILSKLKAIKEDLDNQAGKSSTAKIVSKISDLLEEIQAGKATKNKADEETKKKKGLISQGLDKIKKEANSNVVETENCKQEIAQKNQEIQAINIENRKNQESRVDYKDQLRREQFEIEKADKYDQHLKLEQAKFKQELKEVEKDIKDNFEGKIEGLRAVSSGLSLEELKMKIEKLNWQLEQVKEIDTAAVGECQELQEKYDFLKKESQDLRLTLMDLNNVVVEMDKTIKKKLNEAFTAINKEFAVYFKLMFAGGSAKLEKVKIEKRKLREEIEEGDESEREELEKVVERGIDIKVNPPGKRINNLGMLSGGERTLTSIALLFALISCNPPP
ncbi:MAG: hypothetical protein KAQ63_03385, partial [Candidatus Moranbacteria bacterium]|nr:hypothetical protein [Candidatus Moranbacteria bacterium]